MIFKLCLFVIALIMASVECRPQVDSRIVKYDSDVRLDGYDFGFETSGGIRRQENGVFQPVDKEQGVLTVSGESSYPLLDGVPFYITFIADDKGYRPKYTIGEVAGKRVVNSGYRSAPVL